LETGSVLLLYIQEEYIGRVFSHCFYSALYTVGFGYNLYFRAIMRNILPEGFPGIGIIIYDQRAEDVAL
jgi:hypothetical protein